MLFNLVSYGLLNKNSANQILVLNIYTPVSKMRPVFERYEACNQFENFQFLCTSEAVIWLFVPFIYKCYNISVFIVEYIFLVNLSLLIKVNSSHQKQHQ